MDGLPYPTDIPPEHGLGEMLSETLWQLATVFTVGLIVGLVIAFLLLPLLHPHNGTHRRVAESRAPASDQHRPCSAPTARRHLPAGVEPFSGRRDRHGRR